MTRVAGTRAYDGLRPDGQRIKSGYGLVSEQGCLLLQERTAMTRVVEVLRGTGQERDIRLSATRAMQEEEIRTTQVNEV